MDGCAACGMEAIAEERVSAGEGYPVRVKRQAILRIRQNREAQKRIP